MNSKATWKADTNSKFEGMTLGEVKKMMGAIVEPELVITLPKKNVEFDGELPASFEPKDKWPACTDIYHARDQSNCGSCWAHGTTEAFNDRLCVKNGFNTMLSTADTTGCCSFLNCFSMGCNGGQIGTPWNWFDSTGVVTGGDFGDKKTCYPYTMPQCAHHVTSPTLKDCSTVTRVSPTCSKSCNGDSSITYGSDKHKAVSSYSVDGVDAIKKELYTNGPITVAFTVYNDLLA